MPYASGAENWRAPSATSRHCPADVMPHGCVLNTVSRGLHRPYLTFRLPVVKQASSGMEGHLSAGHGQCKRAGTGTARPNVHWVCSLSCYGSVQRHCLVIKKLSSTTVEAREGCTRACPVLAGLSACLACLLIALVWWL